jgi:hypothetical protein
MNRIDDRFEELVLRRLRTDRADDEGSAARVVSMLATKALPPQRHSIFRHWPSALLNNDFAPAWPRLAALACVALVGCTLGFFGPGTRAVQRTGWIVAAAQNPDFDMSGPAFEPEPLTGARP